MASARALPALTGSGAVAELAKNSGTCPPIRSVIAGPPPLYGTWIIFRPSISISSAPPRWLMLPMPKDAYDILPGCCLTSVTSSLRLRTGNAGFARMTRGTSPTSEIDWKSPSVS
jgi:hypothetical protein